MDKKIKKNNNKTKEKYTVEILLKETKITV